MGGAKATSTQSAVSSTTASSAGGASSTATSVDTSTSTDGGGTGGTQMADPCDSAIFCEDFESYSSGEVPGGAWSAQTNLGSVSVDTSRQVSGSNSVRFDTEASDASKTAYLRLEGGDVFPVENNVYYGRMLFFLESAPTESVHWTFIQGGGTVPGQSYRALYRYGGQHPVDGSSQLMANYETPDSYSGNGPSSDCWQHAQSVVVPVGRWSCVEWMFDGGANEMRLWLDGTAIDSLTVMGSGEGCVASDFGNVWTAPNFETLDIGWESYQADDARTLFVDDVVISAEPIGCPALP